MGHFADEAVNRSPNTDYQNVVGYEASEMLGEVRVADEQSKAAAQITKQFRKV